MVCVSNKYNAPIGNTHNVNIAEKERRVDITQSQTAAATATTAATGYPPTTHRSNTAREKSEAC